MLQKRLGTSVDLETMYKAGIQAYQKAKTLALKYVSEKGKDIADVSSLNPLCPYDIFYRGFEGEVHYCVVKFSFSNQVIYSLSEEQRFFMLTFPKSSSVIFYKSLEEENVVNQLNIEEYSQLLN